MPRKKPRQSKFTVTTMFDSSEESLKSLDRLNMNELKIVGRGNRANLAGIGQLMNALLLARHGSIRFKSTYLDATDLQHKAVLLALAYLGILDKVLSHRELDAMGNGLGFPRKQIPELNKVAEHYMEKAIKYL